MPFKIKVALCQCGRTLENHPYDDLIEDGLPKNWRKDHVGLICPLTYKSHNKEQHPGPFYYIILKDGSAYYYHGHWISFTMKYKIIERKGRLIGATLCQT